MHDPKTFAGKAELTILGWMAREDRRGVDLLAAIAKLRRTRKQSTLQELLQTEKHVRFTGGQKYTDTRAEKQERVAAIHGEHYASAEERGRAWAALILRRKKEHELALRGVQRPKALTRAVGSTEDLAEIKTITAQQVLRLAGVVSTNLPALASQVEQTLEEA